LSSPILLAKTMQMHVPFPMFLFISLGFRVRECGYSDFKVCSHYHFHTKLCILCLYLCSNMHHFHARIHNNVNVAGHTHLHTRAYTCPYLV
jgi:hypothetical protein